MEKDLFGGNDFFKSHELNEQGMLLKKSIPTMPRNDMVKELATPSKPKEVPASVKAFKAKVEGIFDELDKIVKDMKDEMQEWDSSYFCDQYLSFKRSFQQKINGIIQYPMSTETKERIAKEKEGKIQIAK